MVIEWRPVKGYKGLYEVSNYGQVRSVPRAYITKLGVKRFLKSTVLKPSLDGGGYPKVNLYKKGKVKNIAVHRLVAIVFIPRIKGKNIVNHKNGIKTDNRVENLEWVTDSENKIHALNLGLTKLRGSDNHLAKVNELQVLEICNLLDTTDLTHLEIGNKFGISPNIVNMINTGTTWNHITNRKGNIVPNDMRGGNHPSSVKVVNCRGEEFSSITEAASKYGITKHSISHNINGRCKSAGKYPDGTKVSWRVIND